MALKGLGSMIVGFQMWGSLGGLGMSPYVLQRMYKSRYFDFEREPGREWQVRGFRDSRALSRGFGWNVSVRMGLPQAHNTHNNS